MLNGREKSASVFVVVVVVVAVNSVVAQFTAGGQTQPGLPDGCVGSFPNLTLCRMENYFLGNNAVDICKPTGTIPIPSQTVYIHDELNFCINLPNPDSIFLQNNFYLAGKYPTIVQAEGFVQTYCMGSYVPSWAKPMPFGGIRSAHVVKNFTVTGQHHYQIHGTMDCDVLKINCTQSSPGAFDDGGQYDNAPFVSCGKEPYSGVDVSPSGNPGFENYVEQAGDGQFCMRVCEPNTQHPGLPCDVTQDTKGCQVFMGVTFTPGFDYLDLSTGQLTSASVSLPPSATTTTTTTTTTAGASAAVTNAGGQTATGASAATSAPPSTKTGDAVRVASSVLMALTLVMLLC